MAQHCFRNEYFDSLLQSCIPCHLRCSSKPPFSCQSYCNESKYQFCNIICLCCAFSHLYFALILNMKNDTKVYKTKYKICTSEDLNTVFYISIELC
ncbi:TNF receptor superfamily member 17 [Chelydra serpentina]|uniref:TNF receptor superfamily member 17 n=1 Tax=Chelydra serpentina TaxID=8475 RepID=A0A8T1T7M3_CHESE|nr:TNF receptor superfamily member 17 [Chelydra serpentina]